jgi:Fis family transcriptional regulator, factor for inversion stimulation protein
MAKTTTRTATRSTSKTASKTAAVSAASTEKAIRARSGETLEQCVLRSLNQYFDDLDGARPHALHEMVITAVERPLLQFAMERTDGNQSAAAELLGINRNTLRKKLQQYRLG